MCAVIKAYTPPEAPARKMRGDVMDVPMDPAATPAVYTKATRHQQ